VTRFVWIRREFPWIGSGFILAVAESYADQFADQLRALGFTVVTMRCGSGASFGTALKHALRFPDWCGLGWDAIHDCFGEVEFPHPFALMWRDAETFAADNPKAFGEATAILQIEFDALGTRGTQAVLVITGDGPAFQRPRQADAS
jgi:hypothetical protein